MNGVRRSALRDSFRDSDLSLDVVAEKRFERDIYTYRYDRLIDR